MPDSKYSASEDRSAADCSQFLMGLICSGCCIVSLILLPIYDAILSVAQSFVCGKKLIPASFASVFVCAILSMNFIVFLPFNYLLLSCKPARRLHNYAAAAALKRVVAFAAT